MTLQDKVTLAGGVILNENNKVLLIHRNTPKRTQWEIPGGKIEQNENPEQTAKREIKEEIKVLFLGRIGTNEGLYFPKYSKPS